MATRTILLLPGDGIGPEVTAATRKVIDWFQASGRAAFNISEGLIGGASYDVHGTPLTNATIGQAKQADAVLLAAIGGPTWDTLPFKDRPERGILGIRKEMALFANLRPAQVFDALANAAPLKTHIVKGLDIMIVRELTGGVYFGEPRGIETLAGGERRGVNTQVYTTSEIHRVARVAFELARKRKKRVCSVDKANVMESGVLWREEVTKLHSFSAPLLTAIVWNFDPLCSLSVSIWSRFAANNIYIYIYIYAPYDICFCLIQKQYAIRIILQNNASWGPQKRLLGWLETSPWAAQKAPIT